MDGRVPRGGRGWPNVFTEDEGLIAMAQPMLDEFGMPNGIELDDLGNVPYYPTSPSSEQSSFASPRDVAAMEPQTDFDLKRSSSGTASAGSRKRRRTGDENEVSPLFHPCRLNEWRPVLNERMERLPAIELHVEISKGAQYSEADAAWILYRKNHFQIAAELRVGPDARARIASVVLADGTVVPVRRMYLSINGYKDKGDGSVQSREEVELYQSPTNRDKAAWRQPDNFAIREGGRVVMERLHFKTATANNFRKNGAPNPLQCFNQLIVSLWAVGADERTHLIAAVGAGRLVVRGRSPGHYATGAGSDDADEEADGPELTPESDSHRANLLAPPARPGMPTRVSPTVKMEPLTPPSQLGLDAFLSSATVPPMHELLPMGPVSMEPPRLPPPPAHVSPVSNGPAIGRGSDGSLLVNTNLGVRTASADEALVVHGNMRVTGAIYQPSDRRIKQEIRSVDTAESLSRVQAVRLVDYELRDDWMQASGRTTNTDRGVIAQELQQVIPSAVTEIGDVQLPSGRVLHGMLTVNRDALLMETVGATQELAKRAEMLDLRVNECETALVIEDVNSAETERELRARLEAMESRHDEILKRLDKNGERRRSSEASEDAGSVKVVRCEMNWRSMVVALVAIAAIVVVCTVLPILLREEDSSSSSTAVSLDLPSMNGNDDASTANMELYTSSVISGTAWCQANTPLVSPVDTVTRAGYNGFDGLASTMPPTNAIAYDFTTGVFTSFSSELKMYECYYYHNVSIVDQADFSLGFLNFTMIVSNSTRAVRDANNASSQASASATATPSVTVTPSPADPLYPSDICLTPPRPISVYDPPFIVSSTCPRRRPILPGASLIVSSSRSFDYLVTGVGFLDKNKVNSPDSKGRHLLLTMTITGELRGTLWVRSAAKISLAAKWCTCPNGGVSCATRTCEDPWSISTKVYASE